jgi:hypothetical protein
MVKTQIDTVLIRHRITLINTVKFLSLCSLALRYP